MAQFKKYLFEKLFDTNSGYVLDFTNMTFASFIEESVGVDIYLPKYSRYGNSKGKRLKAFFDVEDNLKVVKLLTDILAYYLSVYPKTTIESNKDLIILCKDELNVLFKGVENNNLQFNFFKNANDLTIKELKLSLESDLNDKRYNVALDRLHTYCVKYFRTKSNELGLNIEKDRPLHSLAGEVIKVINIHQSGMSIKILRSSLSVLDNFNQVRNNQSLAHDNEILENFEAKLIVEWVVSLLNFFEESFEISKDKLPEEF